VVPNLAARTQRSYAGLWDRHVLPRLGSTRLQDLTPEVIERYRAELEAADVGLPTVQRALVLLQGVLQRAVDWRRIGQNPVKAVRKPKVRRHRAVRPLSPLSVEVLYEDAAGGVHSIPIGEALLGHSSWAPTLPLPVVANLLPLLPGEHTPIAFRFSAGDGATWKLDEINVDPYRK